MQSCAQADWADVTGSVLRNHMGAVAMGTLQSQILPKRSEADKFYYFKNNNNNNCLFSISERIRSFCVNKSIYFKGMPVLPPPQTFVRRHHRSSHSSSQSSNTDAAHGLRSSHDVARIERIDHLDSTPHGSENSSPRAFYNRLVGQVVHQEYEARHSSASLRRWTQEDLEWILRSSQYVPLDAGDNQSEFLRGQIVRITMLEDSGPPGNDLLEFPDQNESS